MTRGQIVLITNDTVYISIEFNGDMYWEGYGETVASLLKEIRSKEEYEWLVSNFNSDYYQYEEDMIYDLEAHGIQEIEDIFNMPEDYFGNWFSDYLYIKNLRDEPVEIKTRNNLIVTLNSGGTIILYFGRYNDESNEHSFNTEFDITDEMTELIQNLGWSITICGTDLELEKYSPAGEDFFFTVNIFDFKDEIKKYADAFDPDEHAEMWIENKSTISGVPQSVRKLIDDAEAIQEMLTELSDAINN